MFAIIYNMSSAISREAHEGIPLPDLQGVQLAPDLADTRIDAEGVVPITDARSYRAIAGEPLLSPARISVINKAPDSVEPDQPMVDRPYSHIPRGFSGSRVAQKLLSKSVPDQKDRFKAHLETQMQTRRRVALEKIKKDGRGRTKAHDEIAVIARDVFTANAVKGVTTAMRQIRGRNDTDAKNIATLGLVEKHIRPKR